MKKYNITQAELNVKVDLHSHQSINRFTLNDRILENIDLSNKSAPSASCVSCVLQNVNFSNGNFPSTDLQYSDLTNVDFSGANLCFTNFKYTNLKNVNFTGANLKGADFTGCETENLIFENCEISPTTILPPVRTEPVNLLKCTVKKASHVTKKIAQVLVLFASIGVVIGLFVYALYQIWDVLVSFINNCVKSVVDFGFLVISLVGKFISDIIYVLVSVPWFVWVSIFIPILIIGYSYIWCYHKNYPAKFARKLYWVKMRLDYIFIPIWISICICILIFSLYLFL